MATSTHQTETAGHGPISPDQEPFGDRYARSVGNARLSTNVTRYQQNWRRSRTGAMEEISFEEMRDQLKATKLSVIDNIDHYIGEFQRNAERAGAVVHYAATADDANRIIERLLKERNITRISKSKTMVSEEVELNHHLEAAGIDPVETDIGEWIVQKAGQRPSHIVGPALHMGRQDVGELLNVKLGIPTSYDDIPEQVRTIKDIIRPQVFESGAGMNGANALIAESGTVMICTNEGNGRLVSSIPPLQIVLAGIEKLIPSYDDAMLQLRLLGRSGTGQRLTVYTTFMTGPTPGHEMHIVLVDNGRRKMRAIPEFKEALACIRCGACANVCPPYREVGGHVFGHIYTGAIGLVVTQFHHGLDAIAKPQSMCLSCNACETVCPVGIPLPRQIIDVRKMVVKQNGLSRKKRAVLAVYSRPRAFDAVSRVGSKTQLPLTRGGRFVRGKRLPVLHKQTSWRSLPALASTPLRDRIDNNTALAPRQAVVANGAVGKTVALFPGCMTDRLFPEQGEAIVSVLQSLGAKVILPTGLNCCGLPANNMGADGDARRMAKQTIASLERFPTDYIVSGSASCVATLVQDYAHLFRNDPSWHHRAEKLAARVMDFTTFLVKVADLPDGSLATGKSRVVTYHDSCQGSNALGLHSEPRRIIEDILGCELRELEENTLCCGFGGSFGFDYPEVSKRLMRRKIDNAVATGAPVLVSDNQGCLMHLRGGCDVGKDQIEIKHLAQLVAERLREMEGLAQSAERP